MPYIGPGTAVRVVALNWRDLRNPRGGGAEVHMEEILRYLGTRGHRCTLITSGFPGAAREETGAGYRIVRGGNDWNFNLVAPLLYRREAAREPPDVVLDDINKIPLFSPLFASAPVLAVVPHLMGTAVFREVNPIVGAALYGIERLVPRVYRRCRFEVISASTRDDLIARRVPASRISVVHCGIDRGVYAPDPAVPKTAAPSLVFVGRIKRYKCIDHAIRALALVRRRVPACTLTIVGDGDGLPPLRALVGRLGLEAAVRFTGFVPTAEKLDLLRSAHVAVNPSVREGWGLINVEANACGTACVSADSPGLRDSLLADRTGFLYPHGDIDALAERIVRLLGDRALRERMEREGVAWAASLTWERCGQETLALIEEIAREASALR